MTSPSRVAVLAVHGVGNPKPGETAQSIAALLLRLRKKDKSVAAYSSLCEENVTFFAGEVPKGSVDSEALEKTRTLTRQRLGWREEFPHDPIALTREQLFGFTPREEDMAYKSPQIRTIRDDGAKVDVYEVHWSHISRRGTGFCRWKAVLRATESKLPT